MQELNNPIVRAPDTGTETPYLPTVAQVRQSIHAANEQGYTTAEIAASCGVHYNTVRYIRNQKVNPNAEAYISLVKWLHSHNIL